MYNKKNTPGSDTGVSPLREIFARLLNEKNNRALIFVIIAAIAILVLTLGELTGANGVPKWSDACYSPQQSVISGSDMVIHAIDVGQGDCVLVQGGGANILIDAGENGYGSAVLDYLESVGVTKLDWVIGTHPHSDHIGGLDTVISGIDVENVMLPRLSESITPTTATYTDLLAAIESKGLGITAARAGDLYTFGALTMLVVSPDDPCQYTELNDCSVALKFSCGGISFFTAGDISVSVERNIINSGFDISANIYKASHHGSSSSNCADILYRIAPTHAFIMCGEKNDYGHPHREVRELFGAMGLDYRRTDICGSVVYTSDGANITVVAEK